MSSNSQALTLNSQYGTAAHPINVDERAPLLSQNPENVLVKAIFERCIDHSPLIDNHKGSRRVALALSVISSLAANASYIPISLAMPAGPVFAAGNFLGFFKLDIWAIRGTINDILSPKGSHEIILHQRSSNNKCYTVAVIIAALAIALLSQVPVALPALDYNGALGVPSVIMLFLGGVLIPIRSLQLSINKKIRSMNCCAGEEKEQWEQLRLEMISLIDQHQGLFRQMDSPDKIAHILSLAPNSQGSEVEKVNSYISALFNPSLDAPVEESSSLLGRISGVSGVLLTISFEAALAYYTFCKVKENVLDNDALAGVLAGSVVASSVYLAGQSIVSTAQRMAAACLNLVTCKREKTLAEQLRPKLDLSLKLLGLAIDLTALGATIVIWGDFLKDNPSEKIYFEITMCLAYFLFLYTATLDMAGEVTEEIVQHRGTEDERQIIEFNADLQRLKKLIETSSLVDFGSFVTKLPLELRSKLLSKVDLRIENVERFVGKPSSV